MSRRGCRRTPPFDTGLRPARHGYCGSAESALGILSGCGLEPAPLAFLAPAERVHDGPDPSLSTRNFAASVSSLLSPPRPGQADGPSAPRAEGRWGSGSKRGHPEASSGQLASAATPSKQEARDFHGAEPQTYPTSCSLCNACVMSAANWTAHINSSRHADGQLGLLQRFPAWDCRMETLDRADRQSERRTGKDGGPLRRTDDSGRSQPATSAERKLAQTGKVACVKFAAGSVDEPHLRNLTEPFGTVTGILMFPSLAFVELESAEQAQELVKFHKRRPPTANGRRLDFSISSTFSFAKSSRVVSFTPPPQSDDDKSDLLAVVKRFGAPVYTLFRRSKACVEMKSLEDAEKLVNYYSCANLRLNDKVLRVSFAAETSTLRSAASARRYREESTERTGGGDEDSVPEESKERRAEGREGGSGDGRAGSNSRKSETGSPSGDREARSRSREKTCRSDALTADAEKPEATASGGGERERSDVDADSERDGSDIEGMAVLGEDLEDDDLETEEEAEERMPEGDQRQVEPAGGPLPGADGGKCGEGRRPGNAAEEASDEEAFSEDGVTLDKAGREQSGAAGSEACGGRLLSLRRQTQTLVLINKYRRLLNGLAVPRDESGEHRRRRNSRSERRSSEDKEESKAGSKASSKSEQGKGKKARETPERDDATRNSADVLSSSHSNWGNARDGPGSGKAPSVASDAGKNTTQDGNARGGQSNDEKAPQNKSEAGKSPDIQSDDGATPEAASQGGKTAEVKPEGGETEGRHTLRDESKARKRRKEESEPQIRNSPQRESKSRKSGQWDSEAGKAADDVLFSKVPQRVSAKDPGGGDSRQEDNSAETLEGSASPEDACVRGTIQKEEQRSQTSAESDKNQEARGTSGTPATPLRPVGTEFVRPVVGYFCNLCQVIYADEDEAKVRHCSSRQHHFKYREKMKLATRETTWS
ncbi:matrin 3-like 1.1 [Hippocampus comes]|uniref:matrin 3-like 1.1 n=1 Tax=Hippocampus comes TaxID=109280 RepID=UPI00094EE2BA|nr:PREDICTED: matrin-3-like [Hippocampus comes]